MQVRVIDNSEKVLAAFPPQIEAALEAIGQAAETNAKMEITSGVYDTPESPFYRRTGNLRNSISHTADDTTAYVGTNTEYAVYVEMGTSKMPPRPFIKPAVENYVDEYKEIVETYLKG